MTRSKQLIAALCAVLLLCCGGNTIAASGKFDLTESDGFVINPGLNDAWYDPLADGQGFTISVFEDRGTVFLTWYTYDTELQAPPNLLCWPRCWCCMCWSDFPGNSAHPNSR